MRNEYKIKMENIFLNEDKTYYQQPYQRRNSNKDGKLSVIFHVFTV